MDELVAAQIVLFGIRQPPSPAKQRIHDSPSTTVPWWQTNLQLVGYRAEDWAGSLIGGPALEGIAYRSWYRESLCQRRGDHISMRCTMSLNTLCCVTLRHDTWRQDCSAPMICRSQN